MPISDLLAQIAGEKQSSVPLPSPVQKRKADGDLQRPTEKLVRRAQPILSPATTITQSRKPTNPPTGSATPKLGTPSSTRSGVQTVTSTRGAEVYAAEPAKPPKKGSYAEILARAKAAQANLGQVGRIQHKAIEKGLTRRERQELKEHASQSHRVSKRPTKPGVRTHTRGAQNGVRDGIGKLPSNVKGLAEPEKKIKKAALATTGYTGTARPNPATLKTSKSTTKSSATDKARYDRPSPGRRDKYPADDDEEEDEEDDDEEHYYSDASSDMEADMFEVDREEERAARIARKEDEDALREEARHQREKDEKRRRLADLARARR